MKKRSGSPVPYRPWRVTRSRRLGWVSRRNACRARCDSRKRSSCPGMIGARSGRSGRMALQEQKNSEDDEIPMPLGFERILLKTPAAKRHGYISNPLGVDLPRPAGARKPGPGAFRRIGAGEGNAAGSGEAVAEAEEGCGQQPEGRRRRSPAARRMRRRSSPALTISVAHALTG